MNLDGKTLSEFYVNNDEDIDKVPFHEARLSRSKYAFRRNNVTFGQAIMVLTSELSRLRTINRNGAQ